MSGPKFKELVHFMIHECRDNPMRLGSVRLNKALWFADMLAYQKAGTSLSGAHYVKRQRGPVPRAILATLRDLERDGSIYIEEPAFQYAPRMYVSRTPPEIDHLSREECSFARDILNAVCEYSASDISEATHEEIWEAAEEGEEIPLYATLASGRGEITDAVRTWADACIEEIERSRPA